MNDVAPVTGAKLGFSARLRRLREDPNPILLKELRSTFRTPLFIRFLYLSTGLLALIVLSGGALAASSSMSPAAVGETVFQTFFVIAFLVVGMVAPPFAATVLTGERERETYESLILTGSGGHFCAGADLKAIGSERGNRVALEGDGPIMGTCKPLGVVMVGGNLTAVDATAGIRPIASSRP